jgi:hypothetical protein
MAQSGTITSAAANPVPSRPSWLYLPDLNLSLISIPATVTVWVCCSVVWFRPLLRKEQRGSPDRLSLSFSEWSSNWCEATLGGAARRTILCFQPLEGSLNVGISHELEQILQAHDGDPDLFLRERAALCL